MKNDSLLRISAKFQRFLRENGFWLLAFGYWLLAIGFWLLAFGYWLLRSHTRLKNKHLNN